MMKKDHIIPMLREKPAQYGLTDKEAILLFEKYLDGRTIEEFRLLADDEKRQMIQKVKHMEKLNTLQLSRITGVSRGIIQRL